ncbi:MAG: glycoside hydrolase family 25 protein [Thermoflavifilum aggregans]|nr:glycoside hydrolase family 25 protein [Thermoflavifilum aggregans]
MFYGKWKVWMGILGLVLAGTGVWVLGLRHFIARPVFVEDRTHRVWLPVGYSVFGIDISQYQRTIDWGKLRQERIAGQPIRFVFIKATEGISRQDPLFAQHWAKAHAAGFICGAYHFFYATRNPLLQARNFEQTVKLMPGDLPPVLDAEVDNHQPDSVIRQTMRTYLNELTRYYGVKPIIYTNLHFYRNYIRGYLDDYPIWIAQHSLRSLPQDATGWIFWQISDEAHMQGITGFTDLNVFRYDFDQLRAWCLP